MIYELKITDQADKDLRGIYEYIAFEKLAPENAAGQLDRIESAIISLEKEPCRFRLYSEEPWKSRGLRIFPVDNYIVFYIPDEDNAVVTIIRVMYCGRNIEEQLNIYTKYENK
ncbi:toxin ParE1/3/4 [Butyrivibrio fibrisolvens DSM 3071]|uniref:Toxin ParE1/3/4 n=1 Tax=Butyrivibrio fibrisolvens DSM 3071 TaxID=1121131 RepID=A0A1M5XYV3_BUTFI|nr:type II toxin-antitoxin system RelE/ParE family toxin [Butyrivibrio fibrisolvens]SHI04896.1 toxin ParE1/3/4 [Butyrivibrio fibrisolvens DSM 3071]